VLDDEFGFSTAWPATTITSDPSADGNQGSVWNYGASASNDMGGNVAGYATDHSWPGSFGVTDSAYASITLCPGTAGSVCSG